SDIDSFPPPGEAVALLAANYQIPVFWLCMFDPSNICLTKTEMEDTGGNSLMETIPQLSVPLKDAVARCEARRDLVLSMIPRNLHHHYEEWMHFLSALQQPFLHLDISEIWAMAEPGEFEPYLNGLLKSFESNNPADWTEILSQANIDPPGPDQKYNAEVAR